MCYAPGMSPRTPALLIALLVALPALPALTACGGAETPAKAAAKHSCTIMVAKKAPAEVKGSGSSEDKAKAEEAAWADACARLPEAERAGCKDPTRFSPAVSTGSASANGGPTNYNVNVVLQPLVPTVEGKAEVETSKEDACKVALEKACEAAGEKGDCLAGGKFEKKGEISSSQSGLLKGK